MKYSWSLGGETTVNKSFTMADNGPKICECHWKKNLLLSEYIPLYENIS